MTPENAAPFRRPLVSIVLATLNVEKTLERCLESVFDQSFQDWEIVIHDGVSKDSTIEILKRHSSRIRHWQSGPDLGIYNAWNQALDHVRGEWILFLGADDALADPQALSRVAPALQQAFPSNKVVYAPVRVVSETGETISIEGRPWHEVRSLFRHEMQIPHQGTFQHRSLFETTGKFSEDFRICGDYEFLLRELKTKDALFVPGPPLALMQFGGTSSTLKNVPRIIAELELARSKNGITGFSLPIAWRKLRSSTRQSINRWLGPTAGHAVADLYRVLTRKTPIWLQQRRAQGQNPRKNS